MENQGTEPLTTEGAGSEAQKPRKRGCRSCALGCLVTVLVAALLGVVAAGWLFNWPQQWGWVDSPAEALFESSPNPWAAEAIVQELQKQDVPTEGMTFYVLKSSDSSENIAYVLVEDARGAKWVHTKGANPVEGLFVLVANTKAAKRYAITRVAVDCRDSKNVQAAVMTVPTDVAIAFGKREITQAELFDKVDGYADMAGFMAGMSR